VCEITVRQRTISVYLRCCSGQEFVCAESMSGCEKRKVTRRTVDKWIVENDKTLNATIWLKYEMVVGDREHVSALKCGVCIQFRERLMSLRNYNSPFINGSRNTRTSSFKEHTETEMHKVSMALYKKQHSENICDYAPIARAILQPSMDEATR